MKKFIISATMIAVTAAIASAQSPQLDQGKKLFDDERYAEARVVLQPVGSKEAPAAFLLGRIALEQNDAPKAVDWLEKAVALNPTSSVYYDWLGKAYGVQAQKASKLKQPFLANKTKTAWEKAIALDPNNLEAKNDIILYYLQAPGFLGGSKAKARATALDIRQRNPYMGAVAMATVCIELKDRACVEREMKFVIASYPDSAAGPSSLAAFYSDAKQYDEAFEVVDQRLKRKPNDPLALYALGRTASLSGQQLERGEQALVRYIAAPMPNGPAVANAHYRLGMIHEKKGARDLARREYQIALGFKPDLAEAKKALAALSR